MADFWLALVAGNSRLHWAAFQGNDFLGSWHTQHLPEAAINALCQQQFTPQAWQAMEEISDRLPISWLPQTDITVWLASVVAQQTSLWRSCCLIQEIQPDRLPLTNQYPTLGIDRSIALLGAGDRYGWPMLVVDGGTALTFTAGQDGAFWGGAILPGLSLQLRSLASQTDALPTVSSPVVLPPRWATNTPEGMLSGVIYTVIASIQCYLQDWWQYYPQGQVIFTGGDSDRLWTYLNATAPEVAQRVQVDPNLMFWGIRTYRCSVLRTSP